MRVFWNMTVMEFKLFMREPAAAFFTLIFPLILLFVFGGIFGNEPIGRYGGRGTVDVSVPGYIGMIIATAGLMALPISLAAYREKGILKRYRATPISVYTVFGSQVAVNLVMLLVGSIGLFVVGRLVYGLILPDNLLLLFLAFLLGAASFLALGFILAGLLPSSRAANATGNAIFFPMLFLSGAAMPIEILPEKMRAIAEFLPLTHVVNLIKSAWFGQTWDMKATLILSAMIVVSLAVSARTFRWS